MGEVGKALGAGIEIEFEGRTWTMAQLTYDLQAKYETWLERRAVEAVKRQKSYLDESEYLGKMDQVDRNIAAGVYSFGGAVCINSSRSIHGLKELMRICLFKNHPEVNHEFIDRMFEAKGNELAQALNKANSDPLPKTPPEGGG